MPDIIEGDEFDPKKIYDDLLARCKDAKEWTISCVVDEVWYPKGVMPFDMKIVDGLYTCYVIAPTLKEAYVIVANTLPVITFVNYRDEE